MRPLSKVETGHGCLFNKRSKQEPLREIEDEIEDMDDPEWGPGDF